MKTSLKSIESKYIVTSLLWLITAIVFAMFLRGASVISFGDWFNYKYFLHTHSHLAFLGWVFNIIYYFFLKEFDLLEKKKYLTLFYLLNFSVIGMLVTFPFTGYALFSIIFSSLHMVFSYVFAYMFLKDTKVNLSFSRKFAAGALFFMVISSIGPFALGPIIALGFKSTDWYELAIYYYLHFQYNGWFLFAMFSIILKSMKNIDTDNWNKFYWIFFTSTILNLSLSTLWTEPGLYMNVISFVSSIAQIYGIWLVKDDLMNWIRNRNETGIIIISIISIFFAAKLLSMLIGSYQDVAMFVYYNRNLVIGYLHLIFLGIVTPYFFYKIIEVTSSNSGQFTKLSNYILAFIILFILNLTSLSLTGLKLNHSQILFINELIVYSTFALGLYVIFLSFLLIAKMKRN